MTVAHHVAFALAVAALGGAGLRLAGHLGARGLELVVAAAPLGAAAAVLWALGLGLLDLGGSTVALAAGAGLTWMAIRLALPDPAPRRQLADWWAQTSSRTRVRVLALDALRAQPGYDEDERPVAMGPCTYALVGGGDRLHHPVVLVPASEPCADIRARARVGWLVVFRTVDPESRVLQTCRKGTRPVARSEGYNLYGPR